jgi:hypothetical protein
MSAGNSLDLLCQNCVTHPPKHWGNTVIYRDTSTHIVVAGIVDQSAFVGFGVGQHARAESISKRAPSTTRTSLRSSGINSLPEGRRPAQPETVT